MPIKSNQDKFFEVFSNIFDSDKILTDETFENLKTVVNFDESKLFLLSPTVLSEIYPNDNEIKISDDLSKALFYEKVNSLPSVFEKNHYITYLKVRSAIFGIVLYFKEDFSDDDKTFLKAFSKIISYKIKDEELSVVFKSQITTLSKAVNKVKEADKIKTDFISNVSHELRSPLNSIIGFSDLLKNKNVGVLNEKQLGYVSDIQASSVNLLSMINDILDISKIENSAILLVKQKFEISRVINEVVSLIRPLLEQKNIKLMMNVEDFEIDADYQKLKQVLFNLLSNAIKFTDDKIQVSTKTNGKTCEISVSDNGIGIEKKNQKKIFKKFVQINDYSMKKESSTGLGLTISKEFVKLHGGEITVKSELNKGATFIINLPLNI